MIYDKVIELINADYDWNIYDTSCDGYLANSQKHKHVIIF